MSRISEISDETGTQRLVGRRLETLDDIPREIADRRLHSEFGEHISAENVEIVRENADKIEPPDEFADAAKRAGIKDTEGVLGWSTDLESPAHVLKNEVPQEIATLIHEDLHRLTHPETLREMNAQPAFRELYEGITEYLTEHAADGLHEYRPGECYPEQVSQAERLAAELGEPSLRKYFFEHEMDDAVAKAIEKIANPPR